MISKSIISRMINLFIFLLLSLNSYSQEQKRFEYKRLSNLCFVTPIFDQTKPEGARGLPIGLNEEYAVDLFMNPIKEILPKVKRDSLHLGTGIYIYFNKKGEITNCRFMIYYKDTAIISEDDMYNLYVKFKLLKIDMSKIRIDPDYNTNWTKGDYAEVLVQFLSHERRNQLNKSREDKMLKQRQDQSLDLHK